MSVKVLYIIHPIDLTDTVTDQPKPPFNVNRAHNCR